MESPKFEKYLGDGVYASFDGYNIVLDLRDQGTDRIYLEPAVFAALIEYQKQLVKEFYKQGIYRTTCSPYQRIFYRKSEPHKDLCQR